MEEDKKIKCLVWDLDNTLWDGTLLEDENVSLKTHAADLIVELDQRGILQSIASRNDHDTAMEKLKEFNLADYFIYPQINWGNKSDSIETIAQSINIGKDTIAFLDDQQFELDEVKSIHPEVICLNEETLKYISEDKRFIPKFITEDSKNRRKLYQADIKRNEIEKSYQGSQEGFLSNLNMVFKISEATEKDLARAEELTVRTHQLNTTGYTYSYDELKEFIDNPEYKLFITELSDAYGSYGKIGLALVHCRQDSWVLKLILMSCRVMSRGVGSILINHIINLAHEAGVNLKAEFKETPRNRMMMITFKLSGFSMVDDSDGTKIFERNTEKKASFPDYVELIINESHGGAA